jgi:hypothetical protein
MDSMNQTEHGAQPAGNVGRRHELAKVTVDGHLHEVPRGEYVVSEFKKLVGVDAARELDEVVHGELKPLDDNARIEIKGGEVFVSHVRTGGSS